MSKLDIDKLVKASEYLTCNDHFYYNEHGNGCTMFKSQCPQCQIIKLTAERDELKTELSEWSKLKEPSVLHATILRGDIVSLAREQALHIAGATDYDSISNERDSLNQHLISKEDALSAALLVVEAVKADAKVMAEALMEAHVKTWILADATNIARKYVTGRVNNE